MASSSYADDSVASTSESSDLVNNSQENTDGIFEKNGKLAFVHHKKEVVISNFTTKVVSFFDASSVSGYIFEISSNGKTWQCALTLGQLCDSKIVMGILQNHCQDNLWHRVPRDAPSYVDLGAFMFKQTDAYRISGMGLHRNVALVYPAWQKCGTFVVSNDLQVNPKLRTCLPFEERYVLYEKSWHKNKGKGASSDDVNMGIAVRQPFSKDGIKDLLLAFKGLLSNNYPAACLALGGTIMSLGYQRIIQSGGSCPVVLLTGDTETSKTTVLKACISLTGNSEARDFTAKKALERSKKCDIPYAWDDPSSKDDVKFIVQALFNQAGKDTVHSSGYPRSPPIISANFACANDKRIFSRQAIIIFERPNPQHPSQIMAVKKAALDLAAKKASTGFLEALCLVEKYLDPSSVEDRTSISTRTEMMFPGRIRSPEIYSKVMWFTVEVMKLTDMEGDVPEIWDYLENKVAPFIADLFSGVRDAGCIEATGPSATRTVWDTLGDFKNPLSKKQALTAFKQTIINGRRCLAIAYEVACTYLKQPCEGRLLLNELKEQPNAIKGRLHFLSPESDTDYFRITNGKVVAGKAIIKACVSIPLPYIPKEFLRAVKVEQVDSSSSSSTSQTRIDAFVTSTDPTSDQELVSALIEAEKGSTVDGQADEVTCISQETITEDNSVAMESDADVVVVNICENDTDVAVVNICENDTDVDGETSCVHGGDGDTSHVYDSDDYGGICEEDREKLALDKEIYSRSAASEATEARAMEEHSKSKRKKGAKNVSRLMDDIHPGIITGKRSRKSKRT